ncbi:hypothetical protein BEP19_03410 [Ammoniphilus oxalaticus]|uniref:ATP-grasp domain-containing protein n=1 Tax=Ammoniphilus oxalaticus TaxID=66863 RepID=A0A419SNW4_9BACL|nr:YheC/YheD family protein [Ammoniphilus oxalaticus]RKD25986.1 hypothetical protein BEP19_03410 [Ammoniphilus oxalaticus]
MSKNYDSKRIKGKLRVYEYLRSNKGLQSYLPYTVGFSEKALIRTTSQYRLLYVKPNQGTHGKGVMQLKRGRDSNKITVRSTSSKKTFSNSSKLYAYLKKEASSRRMLIQKGIELEKTNGNPYYIRAMVQRKPSGKWVCTGMFTKVAPPKKIVTNYYQGGKIVLLNRVFQQLNLTNKQKKARLRLLSRVSLQVANTLSARQRGMYEMGIDFAFDRMGRLWIIEVNTRRPQFYPLKRICPTMYKKMLSYAKSYGRKSAY